ncbi:MAG: tRNA epoxyqueuosine(34) reductase QueG [Bacteroidota bacterium]|nr:tRNA epoxyqueuosine(34) reductase QueG [Bacteroidota bacterium]
MKKKNTKFIKDESKRLGFSSCGISKARFLSEEADNFEKWLTKGYQGSMSYLEKNIDKRLDPRLLVPGSKSVISLSYNYFPPKKLIEENNFIISKYAYGKDYHKVLKKKLKKLFASIREKIGKIEGRVFVDSAPIHERAWAKLSGLGWVGKNSLLINKNKGSYFFLAEIICDLELEYDEPVLNRCGSCTRCIDACPTDAITEAQVIDAKKCISYLTIENKENIPEELSGSLTDSIFGCDICQDVCPWNKRSTPHNEKEFLPNKELQKLKRKDWIELTEETFNKIFEGSAVKRTKYKGLTRNIKALT